MAASSGVQVMEMVAARVSALNDDHNSHYSKDEMNSKVPHIQADISSW